MSNKPVARKKGSRRRWLIAGVGLIILAIAAGVGIATPTGQAAAQVKGPSTVSVTRGRIVGSVTGNGTIAAEQTTDLAFQAAGTVNKVLGQAGGSVKAG